MRRLFLTLVFAAWGAAAPAQQANMALVGMIENCIRQHAGRFSEAQTAEACVGTLTRPSGQSTIEIADWVTAEFQAWDFLLNAWWPQMRNRAKAAGTWDSLLARQRQWNADKEATCAAAYDEVSGGTLRLIAWPDCMRRITATKTIEFYYVLAGLRAG